MTPPTFEQTLPAMRRYDTEVFRRTGHLPVEEGAETALSYARFVYGAAVAVLVLVVIAAAIAKGL